jgi:hypothetical protein
VPRRHVREYLALVGNLHNLSEEQVEQLDEEARVTNAMVDDLVATAPGQIG